MFGNIHWQILKHMGGEFSEYLSVIHLKNSSRNFSLSLQISHRCLKIINL